MLKKDIMIISFKLIHEYTEVQKDIVSLCQNEHFFQIFMCCCKGCSEVINFRFCGSGSKSDFTSVPGSGSKFKIVNSKTFFIPVRNSVFPIPLFTDSDAYRFLFSIWIRFYRFFWKDRLFNDSWNRLQFRSRFFCSQLIKFF